VLRDATSCPQRLITSATAYPKARASDDRPSAGSLLVVSWRFCSRSDWLVVIRRFLSWSLVVEMEGRWPWRGARQSEWTGRFGGHVPVRDRRNCPAACRAGRAGRTTTSFWPIFEQSGWQISCV